MERMERVADRLREFGFDVLLLRNKKGRPPSTHPCSKLQENRWLVGLDVGLNVGLAVLSKTQALLAHKKCADFQSSLVSIRDAINLIIPHSSLLIVEGAYCPSYKAVFLCGFACGVGYNGGVEVVIVPPHKKPPVRKIKSGVERLKKFLEEAKQWYDWEGKPTTGMAHSVSAFGVIEAYLEAENGTI